MAKFKTVFLGGTCNESVWRDNLQDMLHPNIAAFNPVVSDWDEAAYHKELYARRHSDYLLYTLTPKMTGVYSVAEVVDDSNKNPKKTILCVLQEDGDYEFTYGQLKSLEALCKMIVLNGSIAFSSLEDDALYLNKIGRAHV